MTPQGQLLTLKGPLFSGPVVAVSPALLEGGLKPQVASSTMSQSGMWWYSMVCKYILWLVKNGPLIEDVFKSDL